MGDGGYVPAFAQRRVKTRPVTAIGVVIRSALDDGPNHDGGGTGDIEVGAIAQHRDISVRGTSAAARSPYEHPTLDTLETVGLSGFETDIADRTYRVVGNTGRGTVGRRLGRSIVTGVSSGESGHQPHHRHRDNSQPQTRTETEAKPRRFEVHGSTVGQRHTAC